MARMKIRDTQMTIEKGLTPAAVKASKQTLGEIQVELEDLIAEQRVVDNEYARRRREIVARQRTSMAEVRTGKAQEVVDVREEGDLDTGIVHIIQVDENGDAVKELGTRLLRADERTQLSPPPDDV